MNQVGTELIAEPQRTVRRAPERLDVEVGAGEQAIRPDRSDRPEWRAAAGGRARILGAIRDDRRGSRFRGSLNVM